MTAVKITAPNPNFEGQSRYGDILLNFTGGEATYDGELPDAVVTYFKDRGYGIGGRSKVKDVRHGHIPEPADPRDVGTDGDGIEKVGAPLRDAAVDPRDDDFLPPTNAGKANPHGSRVVSPEIHAAGDQPVVPGPVGRFEEDPETGTDIVVSDVEVQEARETQYADRVLVGGESVPDVLVSIAEQSGQPQPAEQLAQAADWTAAQQEARAENGYPAGNASLPAWQDYAKSKGASDEELASSTRNELRDKYGPK